MYCSKCGNELNEGDLFCEKCGAPNTILKTISLSNPKPKIKKSILCVIISGSAVIVALILCLALGVFSNRIIGKWELYGHPNKWVQITDDTFSLSTGKVYNYKIIDEYTILLTGRLDEKTIEYSYNAMNDEFECSDLFPTIDEYVFKRVD